MAIVAASCATDGLPGSSPEASERAEREAKGAPAAGFSSATTPKDLRAAHIAAVQGAASAAYAAMVVRPGRLLVENEAQRFTTTLDRSGAWVASDEAPWSLSMRAAGLGCEEAVSAVSEAEPKAEGNRVLYRHEGLLAWYLNGPLGLEQGFVIAETPACTGAKVVTIELGGDLRAELDDANGDGRGEAIRLVDAEGRAALSYADLLVKDAQGDALQAWLSVEAGQISIHVDDAGAAYPVEIDPLITTQQAKLLASDAAATDFFGDSVALSGDTALVGAYGHDDAGPVAGSAYVFVRSAGVWTQQAKLVATDAAADKYFGTSVALSGDTALVGASGDADHGLNAGAAYVFARSAGVWTQQAKLVATDAAEGDYFGISVALSGDTALLGTPGDDDKGSSSGAAYVFVRSAGVWTQQAKLVATNGAALDYLGSAVALSGDTALVASPGGHGFQPGSAYVFVRSAGVWTQQASLHARDPARDDTFGSAVALSGDTALVGAQGDDDDEIVDSGSAYVFVRSAGVWTQQAKLMATDRETWDYFGSSVALSGDTALVGALLSDNAVWDAGAAYVFQRSAGVWTQQAALVATNPRKDDGFGDSVALSDGTALVGVHGDDAKGNYAGSAYVYVIHKTSGERCATGTECASGFCVDGVCCDTACGGGVSNDCQACSAAAGAALNGTCGVLAANTECRAAAGGCDAAEVCDGTSVSCPADARLAAGTQCRAPAGVCDVAEVCDGSTGACPADTKVATGTQCRASAGVCDVAEVCDGRTSACPPDTKVAAGTQCRASAGVCDVAEACDGRTSACPPDALAAAGTQCRAATGPCDIAESCDGADSACPADAVAGVTTDCRPAAGPCDIAEQCDGANKTCTPDVLAPAGWVCRDAVGECNVAETCNGISVNCPADDIAPDGAMCTDGVCVGGACMSGGDSTTSSGSGGSDGSGGDSSISSSSSSGSGGLGAGGGYGGSGGSGSGGDSTSNSSSSGGSAGGESRDDGGCACRAAGATSSDPRRGAGGAALALLGLMALRRRRAARG
ncbi:MYXO-CTERM sorting domain-containing protein [Sorangium sp. So ce124]|uniref:MYXO-CTERM sorting domain-containing protein n=1 Tax=Sorangium sp. So ce124 TaxID=3133280 RepID=UPI003F62D18F